MHGGRIQDAVVAKLGIRERMVSRDLRRGAVMPHDVAKAADRLLNEFGGYFALAGSRADAVSRLVVRDDRRERVYIPGLDPLTRGCKLGGVIKSTCATVACELVEREQIPDDWSFIFDESADAAIQIAEKDGLPFLSVMGVMGRIFSCAPYCRPELGINPKDMVDPFGFRKEAIGTAMQGMLPQLRQRIVAQDEREGLRRALNLAVLGNRLGLGAIVSKEFNAAVKAETLPNWIDTNLQENDAAYYVDHSSELLAFLGEKNRRIVYVLDNAGEAVIDLLAIGSLLQMGHTVKVVAREYPTLNDETVGDFTSTLRRVSDRALSDLPVIPAFYSPGADLLTASDAVLDEFAAADLIILKGEGNFMGMSPRYQFKTNVLYATAVKEPLFFSGVKHLLGKAAGPRAGEKILWFRRAAVFGA